MKEKDKIYIAGKVSGLTPEQFHKKFDDCAEWVRNNVNLGEDYDIINPTALCEDDWSWLKCMTTCIEQLRKCKFLFLMPDWKDSKGGVCEYFVAVERGIAIGYLEEDGVDGNGKAKYSINNKSDKKIKCLTK